MKKIAIYTLVTLLSIAAGIGGVYLYKMLTAPKPSISRAAVPSARTAQTQAPLPKPEPEPEPVQEVEPVPEPEPTPVPEPEPEPVLEPLQINLNRVKVEQTGEDGFMVSGLKAVNQGDAQVVFTLRNSDTGFSATSSNGVFESVPASPSGEYLVTVSDGKRTSVSYKLRGFKLKPRLTITIDDAMVNSWFTEKGDEINGEDFRADHAAYFDDYDHFKLGSNLADVTTLQKAIMRIGNDGYQVRVSDVKTNGLGYITYFYVELTK